MRVFLALLPRPHPYSLSMTATWYDRMVGPGLLLSLLLFLSGLVVPVASVDQLLFFTGSYSILAFIHSLYAQEHYILAAVIAGFSVLFPFLKLLQASRLWWFMDRRSLDIVRALGRLEVLSKWSMMDVFVVAVGIVVATATQLSGMTPRIGLYLFGGSVLVSMMTVGRMTRLASRVYNAETGP